MAHPSADMLHDVVIGDAVFTPSGGRISEVGARDNGVLEDSFRALLPCRDEKLWMAKATVAAATDERRRVFIVVKPNAEKPDVIAKPAVSNDWRICDLSAEFRRHPLEVLRDRNLSKAVDHFVRDRLELGLRQPSGEFPDPRDPGLIEARLAECDPKAVDLSVKVAG